MTREEFKQDLKDDVDAYGKPKKLMGKVNRLFDEHEAQLKVKDKRIAELEEAMKPKTCDGCKHKPNEGECYYEPCGTCARFFYDHYEPKE